MCFYSSCWYLISTSINSSIVAFSSSSLVVGGGINNSVVSICSPFGLSCSKFRLCMSNLSTSSFELGSDWGLGKSQSDSRLFSPVSYCVVVCALIQSLSDQSDSWGEGCKIFCLQNEQDSPNLSHILTETGSFLSVSVTSNLVIVISGVLGLFAFIGLYLDLIKHLVLILPGALFLGLFCIKGGAENGNILPLFLGTTLSFPVILVSLNLASQRGERYYFLTPHSKDCGPCGMVFPVSVNAFYHPYSQFYIYCVCQ